MANNKRKFLQEYKSAQGCAQCGYNEHYSALDFDHIDSMVKNPRLMGHSTIANSRAGRGKSIEELRWDEIEIELTRVQVLCSNCHRVKTHMEKNHLCKQHKTGGGERKF